MATGNQPTPEELQKQLDEMRQENARLTKEAEEAKKKSREDALDRFLSGAAQGGAGATSGAFKIGVKGDDNAQGPSSSYGAISWGLGDMAVSDDIARAVSIGLIPPLAFFEEQNLHFISLYHKTFLPPTLSLTPKDKKAAIDSWQTGFEEDHLLPPLKCFAAVDKMVLTVSKILCEDQESRDMLESDLATFQRDLIRRATLDGSWRIVREYILYKIDLWRGNIQRKMGWEQNRLSAWDDSLFSKAQVNCGVRAEVAPAFRTETDGAAKTPWGEVVVLSHAGTAAKREKITQIRLQDHEIGKSVLEGKEPEGRLPASLDYTFPWDAKDSLAGPSRNVGNGRSDRKGSPYADSNSSSSSSGGGRGGRRGRGGANNGGGGRSFRDGSADTADDRGESGSRNICLTCGSDEHQFRECNKVHSSLKIDGNSIIPDYDDGTKKEICKLWNLNRCKFDDRALSRLCPIRRSSSSFRKYLALFNLNVNPRFAAIPEILDKGSELGIPLLRLNNPSFYATNRQANDEEQQALVAKVEDMLARGVIEGPYSQSAIEYALGPCQASSLKIIPKTTPPGAPKKWRLVEDFSGPYSNLPAGVEPVNERIDSALFPCTNYSFREVVAFFRKAAEEPTTLVMGLDFENGFEHVPLAPAVKHRLVLRVGDEFYVRHVGPFGLRSTPGEFGALVDASLEILRNRFRAQLDAISHVDDLSIAIRDVHATPAKELIEFLESLGWRINDEKTELPTRKPTHVGCVWDLDALVVSIKEDKRTKYGLKLEEARGKGTATKTELDEVDSLVGCLQYVTLIKPEWRYRLRRLYRCRSLFEGDSRRQRFFTESEQRDLGWWQEQLAAGPIASSFAALPRTYRAEVATDASNVALGVWIREPGCAPMVASYPLMPEWREKLEAYIGNPEAWAVEAAVDTLIRRDVRDALVEVLCDNTNVVDAWRKGWSRNALLNLSIARLLDATAQVGIALFISYVATDENPADAVSRLEPVPGSFEITESERSYRPFGTEGGRDPFSLTELSS
ncbi:hypothetical protein JCM10908_002478 [Rhodotorula pacifica]|uniref:uncharacterized protein n=1 Tax=Rhodotorula pacifica TaxID=1495444 RepID=UPI00317FC242